MVVRSLETDITANTYRQRAVALMKFKNIELKDRGVEQINCKLEIGDLMRYLLKYEPSITVRKRCECSKVDDVYEVPLIEMKFIKNKNAFVNILKTLYYKDKKCLNCKTANENDVTSGKCLHYFLQVLYYELIIFNF